MTSLPVWNDEVKPTRQTTALLCPHTRHTPPSHTPHTLTHTHTHTYSHTHTVTHTTPHTHTHSHTHKCACTLTHTHTHSHLLSRVNPAVPSLIAQPRNIKTVCVCVC